MSQFGSINNTLYSTSINDKLREINTLNDKKVSEEMEERYGIKKFRGLTIDKLILVTTLSYKQKDLLFDMFKMKPIKRDSFYDYETFKDPDESYFFIGLINPNYRNPDFTINWKQKHYNCKIQTSGKTFMKIPERLAQFISTCNFKVLQIDLAYDWELPISKHFTLFHGNTEVRYKHKEEKDGEVCTIDYMQNYYLYGQRSSVTALIYDKKRERIKEGFPVLHDWLRFEISIYPKLIDQTDIRDRKWIVPYLKKFQGKFVPDIKNLDLTAEQNKGLRQIMRRREKYWDGVFPKREADKIKKIIKDRAFDFVNIYKEYDEKLWSWIHS